MVGTVAAAKKGTKRGAPLLSTNPNDDDGAKRQRVDPSAYVADSTISHRIPPDSQITQSEISSVSHRTPPESQITQSDISSAIWSCGSTDAGTTAAFVPQDDDFTGIFAQSGFQEEEFDSISIDSGVETTGAGLGDLNVSVEPPLPLAHDFADTDQEASFGDGNFDDYFRQTDDLNIAELEGTGYAACLPAGGLTGEKCPAHPKKPVVLSCWREDCSYTTTQQRHLNAHEAR
jgi:hypothetical protein